MCIRDRHYDHDMDQWYGPWLGQSLDHHGWIPRIDVGTTNDFLGFDSGNNVVVVYTAQNCGNYNFHTHINAWPAGSNGSHASDQCIIDPDWDDRMAGLPCVDISPEANGHPIVAVAFIQNRPPPGIATHFGITLWNSHNEQFTHVSTEASYGIGQAVFPSVAVHYHENTLPVNQRVSVSYFMSNQYGAWVPQAKWVRIGGSMGQLVDIDPFGQGEWPEIYSNVQYAYGLNTALTVFDDQSYWVAWSDRAGYGGRPVRVKATYGYTD